MIFIMRNLFSLSEPQFLHLPIGTDTTDLREWLWGFSEIMYMYNLPKLSSRAHYLLNISTYHLSSYAWPINKLINLCWISQWARCLENKENNICTLAIKNFQYVWRQDKEWHRKKEKSLGQFLPIFPSIPVPFNPTSRFQWAVFACITISHGQLHFSQWELSLPQLPGMLLW